MPTISLDTSDAVELAELLRFVSDWLASDPGPLDASLHRFVGNPAYHLDHLRTDLNRFAFLLHCDDGEHLVDPQPPY